MLLVFVCHVEQLAGCLSFSISSSSLSLSLSLCVCVRLSPPTYIQVSIIYLNIFSDYRLCLSVVSIILSPAPRSLKTNCITMRSLTLTRWWSCSVLSCPVLSCLGSQSLHPRRRPPPQSHSLRTSHYP